MTKAGLKATTLRLPVELHHQLKKVAADRNVTCEAILTEALREKLERLTSGPKREIDVTSEMSPVLAELFLQSMPTYALIKNKQARIVWVNGIFETHLATPLLHLAGLTITEAGLISGIQKETIDDNIAYTLRTGQPGIYVESLNLKNRGFIVSRALRFVFEDRGSRYLGDISFVEDDFGRSPPRVEDVISRMQANVPDTDVARLFVPFLESAPVAIAIKKPLIGSSVIVWANDEYRRLAGAEDLVGKTTRDAFKLPARHSILENEAYVVESGRSRMAKEALVGREPRWSLRFPILDHKARVALIGVVSPEFRQNPATRI